MSSEIQRRTPAQIRTLFSKAGVVPVFANGDPEIDQRVLRAWAIGTRTLALGMSAFEYLAGRIDDYVPAFVNVRDYARANYPEVVLGAGTVYSAEEAEILIGLGAEFIVSPILDADIAAVCREHNVSYSPGCGSNNEIHTARKLVGAEAVIKVFPGECVGGERFVKAILATRTAERNRPCYIMPTGGVTLDKECLRGWFDVGVFAVGIGSELFQADLLHNEEALKERVRELMWLLRSVRKG